MEEVISPEQSPSLGATGGLGGAIKRHWGKAVVVALALLVWAPRLSGPIDLRYDGGVYYLLGTSLASGHGYRIPSEPGSPEALQYPPLLPALVAVHQRVLGTTDPEIVAPWLRVSYAAIFLAYAVAVLALARRYLRPGFAIVAAALCLLHFETIFLSDLLFAEIPFALVSVIFALVLTRPPAPQAWLREVFSFALAAAGFLLRTAGVALLAAWVLEAVIGRRWRLAIVRGVMVLVPIIAWQTYVGHVRSSEEYSHPAYQYQRASYQYYNVSYADNMRLIDPFRPELGRLTATAFATRLVKNFSSVLASLGEGISARGSGLAQVLEKAQHKLLGQSVIPGNVVFAPIYGLSVLVVGGIIILARRGAWLMVFILLVSIGLVWTTPWPEQFTRYLVPLGPFLSIPAVVALSQIRTRLHARKKHGLTSTPPRMAIAALLMFTFAMEAYPVLKLFRLRGRAEGVVLDTAGSGRSRFFAHDRFWQAWERAVDWLAKQAPRDAIVATSAPHWLYLRTGLRAVLPPMESDPTEARHLLEEVPVSYVIVDQLGFLDISRRYARAAVESDPIRWRLVQAFDETKIYERAR